MDMNHTTIAQSAHTVKEKNRRSMNYTRFVKWISLSAFLLIGFSNLHSQTATATSTCNCPDDIGAVDRIKDVITITGGLPGEEVWIDNYTPFNLPNQVLWRDSISDNSFFNDGDVEDSPLDTMVFDAMGTASFCVWRDGNVAFSDIQFATTSSIGTFAVFQLTGMPGLPLCSATGGESIISTAGDTICLDLATSNFSLFGLASMVDPDNIQWVVTPEDTLTGSTTPMTGSATMMPDFLTTFNAAGNYNIAVTGRTISNCPIDTDIDIVVIDTDFEIEGFDFGCTGDAVPFNISAGFSTAVFDTVTWMVSGGATFDGDSTDVGSVNIDFPVAGVYNVSVVATQTTGTMCDFIDNFIITIADEVNGNIMGPLVVCENSATTYTADVNNLQNIAWTSTSGTILSGANTSEVEVIFSGSGFDTLAVSGMTTSMCPVVDTLIVDLRDSEVTLVGDTAVCLGQIVDYSTMYSDGTPVDSFISITWDITPLDTSVIDTTLGMINSPGDLLSVSWGAIGNYTVTVTGVTDIGCQLDDSFVINVQDTSQFISGPTLVCVNDPVTFELLQSGDSTLVEGSSIDWSVFRFITMTNDVVEDITDTDMDGSLTHAFASGTVDRSGFYLVIAEGTTGNGCMVNDTFRLEVIGNTDLSIIGDDVVCAGGIGNYELLLEDTLQTGPLVWSAFQQSNNAPVIPAAITQNGDMATIDFPNVDDTYTVRVTGTAGPSCSFMVDFEVNVEDNINIVNAEALDSTCLSSDSILYMVNIDTANIDLANVTWSITNNNGTGGAIFPPLGASTGSGMASFLSIDFRYPAAGTYTHRVRGMEIGTGCEFDEILEVTVKDSLFFIMGDTQICIGDTTEYVLLDAAMMPVADFPTADLAEWSVGGLVIPTPAQVMAGSMTGPEYSFAEFSGSINDTLRIVWTSAGSHNLSISDDTECCPIEVDVDILVRDSASFELTGPMEVCADDTSGYKITAFGTAVDDLVPDSTIWSSQLGTVLSASFDSLTILWDVEVDSITTVDTLIFNGYTDNGCRVVDTLVVNIRSRATEIFGPAQVCQNDAVNLELFNTVNDTIAPITDVDSLYWVFSPGNDTIRLDSTVLDVFVDSEGTVQTAWTEPGTYTVRAFGVTEGTCAVEGEWVVMVNESINPTIQGDFNTCINSSDIFSIDADIADIDSITWTVTAFSGTPMDAAQIVSGQGTTEIAVAWSGTGSFRIDVAGTSTGGCAFSDSRETVVLDAANIGQLACNNNVNVTLPDNCELMLRTDQILQEDAAIAAIPEEQFEIFVEDANTGQRLSEGLVDASMIGIELRVVVTHECSGQTCWGFITLEDKTIPDLLCANDTIECTSSIDPEVLGFPVSDDAVVTTLSTNPLVYEVAGFERCGVATLSFEDRTSSDQCVGEFGTVIFRDWTLTNQAGLSSICTDSIFIRRVDIDSIDLTGLPSFTGDDAFECNAVTLEDLQPGTLTGDLDVVSTEFCFNVQATFEDIVSEFCGQSSFRITRTWTILDWCEGGVRTHTQIIDVVDNEGPSITLNSGPINISATDHDCNGVVDLTPDITVMDACSDPVMTTVRIFENDMTGSLLFTITDDDYSGLSFDPDVTQIFIDVESTDACGNTSSNSTTRQITIVDDVDPIPICDETTTISIGDQGWAVANFRAFDDGSFDNCGVASIQIRRVSNNCDDAPDNLVFGEFVTFCCADAMLGEPILVELQVTDVNGNVNQCTVSVNVQDNSAISLVVRTGDITISCQDDIEPFLVDDGTTVTFLSATCGIPQAPDFFGATVDTTACGTGTITRNWMITDDLGNQLSHTQVVTIGLPSETFDPANIASIWPADFTGPGCAGPNTGADVIPAEFRPNIDLNGFPCSQLGLDYEDVIFRNTEGFCAKVIRTWTLFDWCLRDEGNTSGVVGTHVQILRLTDETAPVIITGCQSETFHTDSDFACTALVSTSATAEDCHDTQDLFWTYRIDDSEGISVIEGNRPTVTTTLPVGTYSLTWTATDPCGNSSSCVKELIVADLTPPSGVLVDITRVLTADGITVDGDEVLLRASDNCSDIGNITVRFNTPDGPTSLFFDCSSLLGQNLRSVHPDVFLIDEAGNVFESHANIIIEDINNVCPDTPDNSVGTITGQVFTERDFTVDEVEVTLTARNSGASAITMTPLEGRYAFNNVPMQEAYEIRAAREDDYLNGVSTLDLILIQRHILGLSPLDSPYKVIAADVDFSGNVSAVDLVHLRRLILGQTTDLPAGQPWAFVDAAQEFDDETFPFPWSEKLFVEEMLQNLTDMDFIGVKLGDVNGNVQLQSSLLGITRSIAAIEVAEVSRSRNQVVIGLTPDAAANVAGLQIAMGIKEGAEVLSVTSDQINIVDDQYTVVNGELRISWNELSARSLTEGAMLYVTLSLDNAHADIDDLVELTGTVVDNEIYTEKAGALETSEVYLSFADQSDVQAFVVEQNAPNPFNGETQIRFYQPQNGDIEFTVVDLSGRQLMHTNKTYAKGWHTLSVQADDLPGAGIYIYEMSNGQEVVRQKMITIK